MTIGLEIGCVDPSNTVGGTLQLQYAQYLDSSHTNFTTFANIGGSILIDNSANNPCPGVLEGTAGTIPPYNPNSPCCIEIYQLRVLGKLGGGAGDNPRFSFVHVYVNQIEQNVVIAYAKQKSIGANTGFVWSSSATLAVQTTLTVTINWASTNLTSTGCGLLLLVDAHCWESGTSSDTITAGNTIGVATTVTYATAFTGTTKTLVTVQNPNFAQGSIYVGDIDVLMAQTMTV